MIDCLYLKSEQRSLEIQREKSCLGDKGVCDSSHRLVGDNIADKTIEVRATQLRTLQDRNDKDVLVAGLCSRELLQTWPRTWKTDTSYRFPGVSSPLTRSSLELTQRLPRSWNERSSISLRILLQSDVVTGVWSVSTGSVFFLTHQTRSA
jgi:hypothetical protein